MEAEVTVQAMQPARVMPAAEVIQPVRVIPAAPVAKAGPVEDMLQAVPEGTRGIAREAMRAGPETPPAIVAETRAVIVEETLAVIAEETPAPTVEQTPVAIAVEMPVAIAVGTWRAIVEARAELLAERYL